MKTKIRKKAQTAANERKFRLIDSTSEKYFTCVPICCDDNFFLLNCSEGEDDEDAEEFDEDDESEENGGKLIYNLLINCKYHIFFVK